PCRVPRPAQPQPGAGRLGAGPAAVAAGAGAVAGRPAVAVRAAAARWLTVAMPPPRTPRLVVLASGRGSNLQALLDAAATGVLAAEVAGVLSDRRRAGALQRARDAGIPALALARSAFDSRQAFDR